MKKQLTEQLAPGYTISVESESLLATADGPFPLEIHNTKQFGKTLYMGGHFMTSEVDEFVYHELIVHPPLMEIEWASRVLIIGGGDGGAVEEVLKYEGIKHVDLVEIDRSVVEFSHKHLQVINNGKLRDARVHIHIADGYDFVMETRKKDLCDNDLYDVIILDLTDPEGPAERLYTTEFFSACKRLLIDDGAFMFHLGSAWTHPQRLCEMYDRATDVFEDVRPFTAFVPLYGTLWTFAMCRPFHIDPIDVEDIEMRFRVEQLGKLKYYSPQMHSAMFVLPPFVERALKEGR